MPRVSNVQYLESQLLKLSNAQTFKVFNRVFTIFQPLLYDSRQMVCNTYPSRPPTNPMNSTEKIVFSLATTVLTMVVTACGATTTPTPPSAQPDADSVPPPAETASCISWQNYLASESSEQLPAMPPGFETGCVFRVGQTNSPMVQILRNDLSLNSILTTDTAAGNDGPIPWFEATEIDSSKLDALIDNGDVATYYQACTTTGGQANNCDGFSQEIAYILNDDTACYQGNCLQVPQVHAIYLLSRWDWEDTIYDLPQSFDPKQTATRNEYRTIPLNTLYADVPLIGTNPEDIAFSAFGRASLGEGERATIVNGPDTEDDLSVVHVINEGAADDSIGGYRYRLDFSSFDGDQSQLLWAGEQHYCIRNNPPEWTDQPCS